MRSPSESDDLVEIGYVARAHGVRGELRVVPHDPTSETLFSVERVYLRGRGYEVARARPVKDAILLALRGIGDRNAAERLRGLPVSVERSALELQEDEFLLADLIDCQVVLEDGTPYGRVVDLELGPQDRLVIEDGAIERLLPLVEELVREVDLERSVIVVAPPPGLPEHRRRPRKAT